MEENRFVSFSVAISKMNKSITKLKTEGMNAFGLKAVHSMCLYVLLEHEKGLKLNDIVDLCDYDKALVSRTLKELIELGYIVKGNNEGKYKSFYFLTEQVRPEIEYIREVIASLQNMINADIALDELEIFYKVLNKLENKIEKINIEKILEERK